MDRYIFGDHPTKKGWIRIVDTEWALTCDYEQGHFNETQEFPKMGKLTGNPTAAPRVLRELGEFILKNRIN